MKLRKWSKKKKSCGVIISIKNLSFRNERNTDKSTYREWKNYLGGKKGVPERLSKIRNK